MSPWATGAYGACESLGNTLALEVHQQLDDSVIVAGHMHVAKAAKQLHDGVVLRLHRGAEALDSSSRARAASRSAIRLRGLGPASRRPRRRRPPPTVGLSGDRMKPATPMPLFVSGSIAWSASWRWWSISLRYLSWAADSLGVGEKKAPVVRLGA